ncbi:hypothetical protein HX005_09335 [Acinetobacter sp. R933-2]|uniref:hypothetical protein n=1 Tax=Acinetobacter sp. R933-2 TaxID=2746728 RepID=UPI002577BA68|nr:hypothetical protein [Acinetobacter sp. R933-2]MDM1247593.1 hypothetical protein [Acinetobacter sp. R933-2]
MYSIYSGTDPFEKYDLVLQFELEQEMYEQLFIHNVLLKDNRFIQVEFYVDEEESTLTFFNAEIPLVLEKLAELQHKMIDQNQNSLLARFIEILNEIYQQNKNFYLVV